MIKMLSSLISVSFWWLETSFKLASKITLTSYLLQNYQFTITNFKNYQMQKTPIMSGCPYIAGGKKHLLSFSCISCFMFFSLRIKRSHSSKEGQRWRKLVNSDTVWYPLNSTHNCLERAKFIYT